MIKFIKKHWLILVIIVILIFTYALFHLFLTSVFRIVNNSKKSKIDEIYTCYDGEPTVCLSNTNKFHISYFDGEIGEMGFYYYDKKNSKIYYYYYSWDDDLNIINGHFDSEKNVDVMFLNEKFFVFKDEKGVNFKYNHKYDSYKKEDEVNNLKINGVFDDYNDKYRYYFDNNLLIEYSKLNDRYYVIDYKVIDFKDGDYLIKDNNDYLTVFGYNDKNKNMYGLKKISDTTKNDIDRLLIDKIIDGSFLVDGVYYNEEENKSFEIKDGKYSDDKLKDYNIKLYFWDEEYSYYKLGDNFYYQYDIKTKEINIVTMTSMYVINNANYYLKK